MSVIPQEDNLVMSFSEATRVFNQNQSNAGSFIPGTGDATTGSGNGSSQRLRTSSSHPSHPNSSRRNSNLAAHSRLPPSSSAGLDSAFHEDLDQFQPRNNVPPIQRGAGGPGPSSPYDTVAGPPSVVPALLPTREQVEANPDQIVDIRHPRTNTRILDGEENYSNFWFRTRSRYRVYFAEFLGTMVLVLWGEGTQAQVVAARKTPNDYLSIAWGWGIGFLLAIYLSSGISGGHINPAVTISLTVFRGFPIRKVPGYILAQMLGAFAGAAIIFGTYYGPLHSLEEGYAGVLTTGPASLVPSVASTFFSVFTGAALLMGAIATFTDTANNPASPGMTPLLLGLIMVGIASSFGYQTGFVLNPARDLGPRFLVWATGVSGTQLWLANAAYGIWVPLVAATTGALFGNFLYDLLIYNGRDSPLNYNLARRRSHTVAGAGTRTGTGTGFGRRDGRTNSVMHEKHLSDGTTGSGTGSRDLGAEERGQHGTAGVGSKSAETEMGTGTGTGPTKSLSGSTLGWGSPKRGAGRDDARL